jgi:large subunit ribosomal protein L29e
VLFCCTFTHPFPFFSFFFFAFIHSFYYNTIYYYINFSQSKNTCAHNNTRKAHANGIKKAKKSKFVSNKGMDPKFLRNQKFAKKYNKSKRIKKDGSDE